MFHLFRRRKTLVGLLLLQSSLNEGIRPAIYIAPDKQLVDQVLAEAKALGIDAVDDPRDTAVQSGEKIAVIFDHLRRPETLRTAIAMAFFWPTANTTVN
jgi:hypothetical protein